jgi:uncharacterized repeat protein (TIGR04138 family)
MPPSNEPTKQTKPRTLKQVAIDFGRYPPEAYEFVQRGLSHTVQKVHKEVESPDASRHVTGQQLCEGLRQFSLMQWGMLARTVLHRWSINSTLDFGRIVFALIEAGHMQKTPDDCLEDFREVYEFRTALESSYRIPPGK